MGFLDIFKQQRTPIVTSILPDAAKQEILRGRLPILNTNTVFLKSGEKCHYIDKVPPIVLSVIQPEQDRRQAQTVYRFPC